MKLPSIDTLGKDNVRSSRANYEERDRQAMEIFKDEVRRTKGVSMISTIPSEVFYVASPTFLFQYDEVVKRVTSKIRDNFTKSNKFIDISNANSNPANKDYNKKALSTISSELMQSDISKLIPFLDDVERDFVYSLVANELIGLGVLEPLWNDPAVTEIFCNGHSDIQVEIDGKVTPVASLHFRDESHLLDLVQRMYSSVGREVSATNPTGVARLHDKSRMHVTIPPASPDGINFNIRKHSEDFWTPQDIINKRTASPELLTYIGNLIHSDASFIVIGGTGTGKALAHDTVIPTDYGMTTMGDLKVGEVIFDRHGNKTKVIDKFLQEERDVYEITFDNRTSVYCDLEHNWLVSDVNSRKRNIHKLEDRERKTIYDEDKLNSIDELIADSKATDVTNISTLSKELGFTFNLPDELHFKQVGPSKVYNKIEVLVYLKNYGSELLNDQRHKSRNLYNVLTTKDMIDKVKYNGKYNFQVPVLTKPIVYDVQYTLSIAPYELGLSLGKYELTDDMKSLGIDRTLRIPDVYKLSSINDRLELVKGLIDSSGTITTGQSTWKFKHASKGLVKDLASILTSLAYKPRFAKCKHELTVATNDLLAKSERLASRHVKNERLEQEQTLSIVSIKKTKRKEQMSCITVDSPDSTFVASEFSIPTHNTTLLSSLTSFFKEDDRIVTLEKSLELKPHPRKLFAMPMETVPGKKGSLNENGVTMRDLVESAMIMRPDGIVIGEVIDGSAYDLCQALNTGHWGASTVHADDAQSGMTRLKSLVSQEEFIKGDATLELISAAFDFVIVVERMDDGSRKITQVREVDTKPRLNEENELVLETLPLWEFVADEIDFENLNKEENKYFITGDWVQTNELSEERQRKLQLRIKENLSWAQLQELASIEEREDK